MLECFVSFCLTHENEIKFRRFEEAVKVVQVNLECKRLIDGRHRNESENEREGDRKHEKEIRIERERESEEILQ